MELSVKFYLFKCERKHPIIEVQKNISEFPVMLVFDEDTETTVAGIHHIREFVKGAKSYSLDIENFELIDLISELISSNRNIHKLRVSAQFLNKLIISRLYSSILSLVEVLEIKESISSLVTDVKLDRFKLKSLLIESFDPQGTKEENPTIAQLIDFSQNFNITSFTFKALSALQELNINAGEKLPPVIALRQLKPKANFDNKAAISCFKYLNTLPNVKKVEFDYTFVPKLASVHTFLSDLNKEIHLILRCESDANVKAFTSVMRNKPNVTEFTIITEKFKEFSSKGVHCFDQTSSSIVSLNIDSPDQDFNELMLQQVIQIKGTLKKLNISLQNSKNIKPLEPFLQDNSALTHLSLNLNFVSSKLVHFIQLILPLLGALPNLQELSLSFQEIKHRGQAIEKECPNIQQIVCFAASQMPKLSSLILKNINNLDILSEPVMKALEANTTIKNLEVSFPKFPVTSNSKQEILIRNFQMGKGAIRQLKLPQFKFESSNYLPAYLFGCSLNKHVLNFTAFEKVLAPEMTFSPHQISIDLYLN